LQGENQLESGTAVNDDSENINKQVFFLSLGHLYLPIFLGPLENAQMQGAWKIMAGAYRKIREDRDFLGNAADG
jgi:hypothetical protein